MQEGDAGAEPSGPLPTQSTGPALQQQQLRNTRAKSTTLQHQEGGYMPGAGSGKQQSPEATGTGVGAAAAGSHASPGTSTGGPTAVATAAASPEPSAGGKKAHAPAINRELAALGVSARQLREQEGSPAGKQGMY